MPDNPLMPAVLAVEESEEEIEDLAENRRLCPVTRREDGQVVRVASRAIVLVLPDDG